MVIFRRDIDNCSVPLSKLRLLEATAICVNVRGRPVKLVVVYISLDDAGLSECISARILFNLTGDLNAKN